MAYYATTVKSVGVGTAVDSSGKTLKFIGNLPCEAGDVVWTDGKVIFGNMTRRGGTLMDIPPSGIPVVADWIIASGTTCGYFKRSGSFKKKRIAEDNWVTNARRIYKHGADNILDAEIAITATGDEDGLYIAKWADEDQQRYVLQDNQKIADGEIIIEKDGQQISSVKLSSLAADLIENPMKKDLDDKAPVFEHEEDRVSTSAELRLFHIDTDGKWTAIVKFECEVRRKTEWVDTSLSYFNGSLEYKHEYIPIPADSSYRENLIDNLADDIRAKNIPYEFLLNEGESLEECLGRISLGVAITNFFHTLSSPCTLEMEYSRTGVVEGPTIVETPRSSEAYIKSSYTLKISSDDINNPEVVSGNKESYIPSVIIYRASAEAEQKPLSTTEGYPKVTVMSSEPVTGYERLETFVLSHLGIGVLFHDKQNSESVIFYDTTERLTYSNRTDKRMDSVTEGTGEFTFPLQDGYYQKAEERIYGLVFCAVYDSDDNLICSSNGIIRLLSGLNNFMIAPLGRGEPQSYLLGQRNRALYRVTDSEFTSIGYGLKNFRLREMKNINKAKR